MDASLYYNRLFLQSCEVTNKCEWLETLKNIDNRISRTWQLQINNLYRCFKSARHCIYSDILTPPSLGGVKTPQLRDDTTTIFSVFKKCFSLFFNVNLCISHVYTRLTFFYTPQFQIPRNAPAQCVYLRECVYSRKCVQFGVCVCTYQGTAVPVLRLHS